MMTTTVHAMMRHLHLAIWLLAGTPLIGQNHVPNSDLEEFIICPNSISQIQYAAPWFNARTAAPNGPGPTPDYFNACAISLVDVPENAHGTQLAHSGDGYIGVAAYLGSIPNFREYAEVQLTEPLDAGICYQLTFHISLAENFSNATVGGIGVYFSNNMAVQSTSGAMMVSPQIDQLGAFLTDTLDWHVVTAVYLANGGEQFLTIGNFHDDANTTTLQIDDSHPTLNCYFYIDDVSLVELSAGGCTTTSVWDARGSGSWIYPNPVSDVLHLQRNPSGNYCVDLVDMSGRTALRKCDSSSAEVDVTSLANGIYTCIIRSATGMYSTRLVIQDHE